MADVGTATDSPPPAAPGGDPPDLTAVRRERGGVRAALQRLEVCLAAPLVGRGEDWRADVRRCAEQFLQAWERHVRATEADDGLFRQIFTDAPHLAPLIERLRREHRAFAAQVEEVDRRLDTMDPGELAAARESLTRLLGSVTRHRQAGADLVYQAYEVDLGGE